MKCKTPIDALILIALFFVLSVSCRSPEPVKALIFEAKPEIKVEEKKPEILPEAKPEPEEEKIEVVIEEPKTETPPPAPDAVPFDPSSITKEVFDSTKSDVQALLERLNAIIRDKDYESWVTFLGKDYRAALNDPSFLERISASSVLRKQKVTLRSLRDYFIYVVVPSRAHDRADDIEFIGQNRVKAFTVDAKGRRLRLYDLEKTPTGWEIIN
ncbi:MAG: hypothetical protein WCT14_19695 [Treponemataceae bacterium]